MSRQVQEEAGAHETIEPVAALIRQSASRAIERLRLQFTRHQPSAPPGMPPPPLPTTVTGPLTAASMRKPMDVFVIQFCMYYLDTSRLPPKHYVRLAQEVVTNAVERVLVPALFQRVVSLPMLCESLVLERSAEEVQSCLKEIEEFVDAREALGAWLEGLGDFGHPDYDDDEEEQWEAYDYSGDRKLHAAEGDDGRPQKSDPAYMDEEGALPHLTEQPHAGGVIGELRTGVDIAGWLYQSLEYWLRIRGFLHAWSSSTANLHAFPLKARYERELMQLLSTFSGVNKRAQTADAGTSHGSALGLPSSSAVANAPPPLTTATATKRQPSAKAEETEDAPPPLVKREVADADEDDHVDVAEMIYQGDDDGSDDDIGANATDGVVSTASPEQRRRDQLAQHQRDVATTVLADVLALSQCPLPPQALAVQTESGDASSHKDHPATAGTASPPSSLLLTDKARDALRGIHPTFFTMVHARLSVMVAREQLITFSRTAAAQSPPALTSLQENVRQQQEAMRQQYLAYHGGAAAPAGGASGGDEAATTGLPLDYVPDDAYYLRLMQKVAPEEAELGEDEELFKDEVVDYYKHKPGVSTSTAAATATPSSTAGQPQSPQSRDAVGGRGRGAPPSSSSTSGPKELIKPERFCRMGTGYRWTQYNRTHYDSHTNPPPRMVMWYKFTLLYPLLAETKRDMRNIFHIEDTPKGPADDHCILVFSPGPPYADVAYRIVKQQWDTRRGGVNVSFDNTGRFQLFFRFSNSNYRR